MTVPMSAYSDPIVLQSALSLSQQHERVTARMIAADSGVPVRTVQRALKRLQTTGQLDATGSGRRWGKTYFARR